MDAVVLAVPTHHGPQPTTYLGNRSVPTMPQLFAHLLELGSHPLSDRMPMHHKPARPRSPTGVDESQKLEGFWLLVASPLTIVCGVPPKLQQASLVRVQRQAELPESLP